MLICHHFSSSLPTSNLCINYEFIKATDISWHRLPPLYYQLPNLSVHVSFNILVPLQSTSISCGWRTLATCCIRQQCCKQRWTLTVIKLLWHWVTICRAATRSAATLGAASVTSDNYLSPIPAHPSPAQRMCERTSCRRFWVIASFLIESRRF